MAALTDTTERVPWSDAIARMDWRQGEHVTLIGPTGVGKTELMVALIKQGPRSWHVFLNTKRIDATQDELANLGFRKIKNGDGLNPDVGRRYIIAPAWRRDLDPDALDRMHAEEYRRALSRAFWQTSWTVYIDELEYINRDLKIEAPVNKLLRQGRSQGNSMVLGTQRPRHVTLHAYEQATHLFIWRQSDFGNIARAAELAGVNREEVMAIVPHLGKHDVLYVNTNTGDVFTTNTRWE